MEALNGALQGTKVGGGVVSVLALLVALCMSSGLRVWAPSQLGTVMDACWRSGDPLSQDKLPTWLSVILSPRGLAFRWDGPSG